MFATGDHLKRQVVFTKHALQKAQKQNLDLGDLTAMLQNSKLRSMELDRKVNKYTKWKQSNPEYRFEEYYFVVTFDIPGKVLVITCGKTTKSDNDFNKKRQQKATLSPPLP